MCSLTGDIPRLCMSVFPVQTQAHTCNLIIAAGYLIPTLVNLPFANADNIAEKVMYGIQNVATEKPFFFF